MEGGQGSGAGGRSEGVAEGKTVDELSEAALCKGLEDQKWQDLLAYGRERGRLIDFTEEQSGDLVHEWRKEQRR